MDMRKLGEQLEEYAELEGSEAGEYWTILCDLSQREYAMGDEFAAAVRKELESQLAYIEENCAIVEEEYQPSKIKRKYLRFNNE